MTRGDGQRGSVEALLSTDAELHPPKTHTYSGKVQVMATLRWTSGKRKGQKHHGAGRIQISANARAPSLSAQGWGWGWGLTPSTCFTTQAYLRCPAAICMTWSPWVPTHDPDWDRTVDKDENETKISDVMEQDERLEIDTEDGDRVRCWAPRPSG